MNNSSFVLYSKYDCVHSSPLYCDRMPQTLKDYKNAKFCMDCGFPVPLAAGQKLEGRRGSYQVKSYLGARGNGRLYAGIQLGSNQPIVIKEYLLPERCFNPEAVQQRKTAFTQVAGLTPADGRVQDFRLVPIVEAIADGRESRCYLIMEAIPAISLQHYLSHSGAMDAMQVRRVLDQVLQTLQFLHSQKLRRPSGHIDRGVVHGHLNLDNLLLAGDSLKFHIYLCDLADWELLFREVTPATLQPGDDLIALGYAAFFLWSGHTSDGQPPDSRLEQNWPSKDPDLKSFILRLMGIEQPFVSAEAARLALSQLALPELEQLPVRIATAAESPTCQRWLPLLGLCALLGILAGSGWFVWRQATSSTGLTAYQQLPLKRMADVSGLEPGEFRYVSEQNGSWSFVLKQPIQNGTLGDILYRPKPDVTAQFQLRGFQSTDNPHVMTNPGALLAQVQQGKADFAITSLTDHLPDDLEKIPIAYDGLFVFVPFNKGATLSKALHGQISLTDLRRIYTGEITNWQQLGGPDLKIVPQIPTEPEAVQRFQRLVLQDSEAIAQFEKTVPLPQPTRVTQEQGRREFADGKAGIISFGILSKTWNQCSGYPLALAIGSSSVQALKRTNGKPITPDVNLCDKANFLNVPLFQSQQYPLGYPLYVVYPKDNRKSAGRKFAEVLQSQEGQCLLSQVGLVPLQPLPENCAEMIADFSSSVIYSKLFYAD